jgi:hypothetical protein
MSRIFESPPTVTPDAIGAATPAQITAAINALINSAPSTLDTLGEIAAIMASDESAAAALLTAVAAKVPRWAPATVYAQGVQVVSPNNDVVSANVAHTSSAAYATDVAKWNLSTNVLTPATANSTYGRRGTATLYPEDFGAVGDDTTDDTAAFNAMVTAGVVLMDAGRGHVIFQSDAKTYLFATAPTHPNGVGGAYAQIPLPTRTDGAIFEFRGAGPSGNSAARTPLGNAGTVFRSTASGGLDATYGLASVIGGPAWKADVVHAIGGSPGYWSNIAVILDGIVIRRPDNPTIAGADFSYCWQAKTNNIALDVNAAYYSTTFPTHFTNLGLLMPESDNALISTCSGETYIMGCYAALRFSEHFAADHLMIQKNVLAMAVSNGYHSSIIKHASCEHNNYVIGEINPATGLVHGVGTSHLKIDVLAIEDSGSGPYDSITHINLMDSTMFLEASYTISNPSTPGTDLTFNGTTGALTYRLTNLCKSQYAVVSKDVSVLGAWGHDAVPASFEAWIYRLGDATQTRAYAAMQSNGCIIGMAVMVTTPITAGSINVVVLNHAGGILTGSPALTGGNASNMQQPGLWYIPIASGVCPVGVTEQIGIAMSSTSDLAPAVNVTIELLVAYDPIL